MKRAQRAKREGKTPSTQAAEFVREEIHHIREGKHGARSTKQAIAIGLSKARRAGVRLRRKRAKFQNLPGATPRRIIRRVTEKSHTRLSAALKPVNGRSSTKVLVLRRAKLCKNRRVPPRDVGRKPLRSKASHRV